MMQFSKRPKDLFDGTGLTKAQVLESLSGSVEINGEQRKVTWEFKNCNEAEAKAAIEGGKLLTLSIDGGGLSFVTNSEGKKCYNKDQASVRFSGTWMVSTKASARMTLSYEYQFTPKSGEVGVSAAEFRELLKPKVTTSFSSTKSSSTTFKVVF